MATRFLRARYTGGFVGIAMICFTCMLEGCTPVAPDGPGTLPDSPGAPPNCPGVPPDDSGRAPPDSLPNNVYANNLREWLDTVGARIEAHAGSLIFDQGVWYWFGETRKGNGGWQYEGVNLYSFRGEQPAAFMSGENDTNSLWEFKGEVLTQDSIQEFLCNHKFDNGLDKYIEETLGIPRCNGPKYAVERPKVLYCKSTKKFVMWLHLDNHKYKEVGNYKVQAALVAKADSPGGPWVIHNAFRTGGHGSLDLNLWLDRQTEEAYVVRSVENRRTAIARLSDDYLGTDKDLVSDVKGENCYGCFNCGRDTDSCHVEGCAMWRPDASTVYMVCSELFGWDPNPAHMFQAYYEGDGGSMDFNVPTLNHPKIRFKQIGDPFMLSDKSWYTQPSGLVEIPPNLPGGEFPDTFMYMGDNWINGIKDDSPCGGYPDTSLLGGGNSADRKNCLTYAGYKWLPWYKHLPWPIALQNNTEWAPLPQERFIQLSSEIVSDLQSAAVNSGWMAINTYEEPARADIDKENARRYMGRAISAATGVLSTKIMRKIEELMKLWGWFCAQSIKNYGERVGTWWKLQKCYDELHSLAKRSIRGWGEQNVVFFTSSVNRMIEFAAWYTAVARMHGNNNEALKNKQMSDQIRDALICR